MPHALAWRSGLPRDERGDRLAQMLLDVSGRALFRRAADLADHQNGLGLWVGFKEFEDVDERRARNRIAADADTGRLPQAQARQLPNCFVGERAATADDANGSGFVNVTGHDADLALARSNQA